MKQCSAVSDRMESGSSNPLGAHFDGHGTNFAVFSENADAVLLCLFSPDGKTEERQIRLPERTGAVWHGYLPGLRPGALYGYRVEGPFVPEQGHRFNRNKLLFDPYATEFVGSFSDHPATLGYDRTAPEADLSFDTRDSAPHVPKCRVSDPGVFSRDAKPLGRSWETTVIYEAHIKGVTIDHPGIDWALRGTYDALASDAMLEHLTRLGVTAVELLPVQSLKSEPHLARHGLVNYWGYNTIGFFALEPRYLGPAGMRGFRAMVDRLHGAGIEVILDVVYNHSAEGDHLGPTLSFRGIDNVSYYRLVEGQPRYYANDTGCGNTLDISHPMVMRMVLDSLRFWVEVMGVDGFRFDLATTLCRERHGFDARGGFLDAIGQDPLLAGVKLIAEPWDVGPGGYQLGNFPAGWAEWNDRFRDSARKFWRGDGHSAQDLASALLGSADVFDRDGRRTWSSVNFVAAHDGFTLADLTSYANRHNEANGENNADGHHANFSDNFGIEGETKDPAILAKRQRRQRNLLATVFLAQGTPMLLAGDEGGNSQNGNNNGYCQDNPTSWIDWTALDEDMIAYTAALSRFRRDHPVLRQANFLHGATRASDGLPDVEWRSFDGEPLNWRDPGLASLGLHLRGSAENPRGLEMTDQVFVAINREDEDLLLRLPVLTGATWVREIDTTTGTQSPHRVDGEDIEVPARTVAAFHAAPEPAR